jgi:hypothetical protein
VHHSSKTYRSMLIHWSYATIYKPSAIGPEPPTTSHQLQAIGY